MIKKYFTLINRNEGEKALQVIKFHLQHCGFDGGVFIDNDSTDNSFETVSEAKLNNVLCVRTEQGLGLVQAKAKNSANDLIFSMFAGGGEQIAIFPIDCDMIWKIDDNYLEELYFTTHSTGFVAEGYVMYPDESLTELFGTKKYWLNFWNFVNHLVLQKTAQKIVLFSNDYEIIEGDHFAWSRINGDRIEHRADETKIRIYEYHILDHDDLVRKTISAGIGRIVAEGYYFVSGASPCGKHTQIDLDILSKVGNLREKWSEYLLTNEMIKSRTDIIIDNIWKDKYVL
jgi:hypothetical protein